MHGMQTTQLLNSIVSHPPNKLPLLLQDSIIPQYKLHLYYCYNYVEVAIIIVTELCILIMKLVQKYNQRVR